MLSGVFQSLGRVRVVLFSGELCCQECSGPSAGSGLYCSVVSCVVRSVPVPQPGSLDDYDDAAEVNLMAMDLQSYVTPGRKLMQLTSRFRASDAQASVRCSIRSSLMSCHMLNISHIVVTVCAYSVNR